MSLEKAKLKAIEGGEDIEFMFNPSQLALSRTISLEQAQGSRTDEGKNKVSFKHPNPYSLKISNILIDTYETDTSVLNYIEKFKKAVEFSQGKGQGKRPPVYLFTWGSQEYLRVFVKTLSYKLTLFKPNGTPVRATVDLDLEEVDLPISKPGQGTPNTTDKQRKGKDNRSVRQSKK
jgi:hypothetical protein